LGKTRPILHSSFVLMILSTLKPGLFTIAYRPFPQNLEGFPQVDFEVNSG
jgi:hypothetical protein